MLSSWFSSLRVRLMSLVVISVLPAFGLALYADMQERRAEVAQVREHVLRITEIAASHEDRLIEGARHLLVALAHLPEDNIGQPLACRKLFASLVKYYPLYANLGIVEPDGDLVCSATAFLQPVAAEKQLWFRRAVETRDFAIGDYQVGISSKAVITFSYPILNDQEQVESVVFAALDLSWLNRLAPTLKLPKQATITIIDRNGTILARYPNSERWVGQRLPDAPLVKAMLAQREDVVEVTGLDGVVRLYAFTALGNEVISDVYMGIGLSTTDPFAEADRRLFQHLLWLVLAAVIALTAAWIISDRIILNQVRTLVKTTKRLAAGDLKARTSISNGQGELNQLAHVFDRMAESIEHHITLHSKLEQEKLVSEAANRAKTEFLSTMSHELRTPLTSILGLSKLLEEEIFGPLNEKQQQYVIAIYSSGEHLLQLINDLLDLSKIEAGKEDLDLELIQIEEICQNCLSLLQERATRKGLSLKLEVSPGVTTCVADTRRLKQILFNLLSNAVKFTDTGSVILKVEQVKGWINFSVIDTGIGISKTDRASLFQAFQQLNTSLERKSQGTGLGLALARKLAQLHGGDITLESEIGQGSCFTLCLPQHLPSE